jgi:hypothetical protein
MLVSDNDNEATKDTQLYEPGADTFFALRKMSRKKGQHPAEVSKLVSLIRGRANTSGIPYFKLRVQWIDRATPSTIYLNDVVGACDPRDHEKRVLPPVLVSWVNEAIAADEQRQRSDVGLLKRWWQTKIRRQPDLND